MKRIFKLLVTGFVFLTLTGCARAAANTPGNGEGVGKKPGGPSQGITVNKISFQELKDTEIPEDFKKKAEQLKVKRGFTAEKKGDYFYVAVFSGERKTGGYGIKVLSVEDNEGKTNITVEETSPKADQMVTQAITYPYTVIKLTGITDNFVIKNTKGESFNLLK